MKFRERIGSLFSLARRRPLRHVPGEKSWYLLFDSSSGSFQEDIEVSRDSVLKNWTIFSCMSLIAGDIAKCNLRVVSRTGSIWTDYDASPLSSVIEAPNHFQTRQQFIESWVYSKLAWGNTYVLKLRDQRGTVTGLYVLDPCRVNPLVSDLGEVYYQLLQDDLSLLHEDYPAVPASEVIHDRWNCLFHPLVGLSPIFASGLAATQGLRIQENSTRFFKNMSRPSGLLTAPGAITDEVALRLKTNWDANYSGAKIGKVAVLGDGLKYEAMGVTAVDAQMVEQLKLSAETICSTFHVPAFKIGAGTIPAGQKVEDLNTIYFSDALQVLTEALENLLGRGLGMTKGIAVRFDLGDLLKMDSATQISVLSAAVGAGIMAPNEGRQRLNLPPVKGGDSPFLQQQNFSLEALSKRDAQADPFAQPLAPKGTPYKGVWQAALAEAYAPGNFVTHKGALWACLYPCPDRPGEGTGWQLAAKAGAGEMPRLTRDMMQIEKGNPHE